mgnify:CR=1 FL=1
MLLRPVAPGEGVKDLNQTDGKEVVDGKPLLMTEQMQLNQELIDETPMERGDHIREGSVESTFAVGNSGRGAQAFNPVSG